MSELQIVSQDPTHSQPRLDVSVVIPVLDEADSVETLARQVGRVLDGEGLSHEIIFVDDGSQDETSARIKLVNQKDGRVKLIRFRRNFGKAAALCAGFEVAHGRLIVTMDGDLQDDPEEIPRMLEALDAQDLDLVSGWKKERRDPASKRYPSLLFNWVTRKLAQVDMHDFNCGFKVYRREVLEEISVYGELHRYIPVLASRRGFRIGELAVTHHPRQHGHSKYGWDRFYKGLLDLITVLFITKYTRRPLHLFGLVGLLAVGLGFGISLYLAASWMMGESLSNRPLLLLGVLLIILGIQVLTTGLVGEMITLRTFRGSDSYTVRERVE